MSPSERRLSLYDGLADNGKRKLVLDSDRLSTLAPPCPHRRPRSRQVLFAAGTTDDDEEYELEAAGPRGAGGRSSAEPRTVVAATRRSIDIDEIYRDVEHDREQRNPRTTGSAIFASAFR